MERLDKKDFLEVLNIVGMSGPNRDFMFNGWLESSEPVNKKKCFQMIVQLRKKRLVDQAFEFSRRLLERERTLPNYNMFLITRYDLSESREGEWNELLDVFNKVWEECKGSEFEPNIVATLLKCCNKLISLNYLESQKFLEIYHNWEENERNDNSFILAQYYIHLTNIGAYSDIITSYNSLSEKMKYNNTIMKLFQNSTTQVQSVPASSTTAKYMPAKTVTLISADGAGEELEEMLPCFGLQPKRVSISSRNIISDLNQKTFKATLAIVILPDKFNDDIAKWMFAIGYCVHKFGKDNILIFHQETEIDDISIEWLTDDIEIKNIKHDMDVIKQLGENKVISA